MDEEIEADVEMVRGARDLIDLMTREQADDLLFEMLVRVYPTKTTQMN